MRFTTIVSASLLFGVTGSALACDLPKLAVIPPKAQIVGNEGPTRAAANVYFTGMQAYAACIGQELTAAGGDAAPNLVKSILANRATAAVAEAQFMNKLFESNVGPVDLAPAVAAPPN